MPRRDLDTSWAFIQEAQLAGSHSVRKEARYINSLSSHTVITPGEVRRWGALGYEQPLQLLTEVEDRVKKHKFLIFEFCFQGIYFCHF